jgi:hypothetical protein
MSARGRPPGRGGGTTARHDVDGAGPAADDSGAGADEEYAVGCALATLSWSFVSFSYGPGRTGTMVTLIGRREAFSSAAAVSSGSSMSPVTYTVTAEKGWQAWDGGMEARSAATTLHAFSMTGARRRGDGDDDSGEKGGALCPLPDPPTGTDDEGSAVRSCTCCCGFLRSFLPIVEGESACASSAETVAAPVASG